MRFDYGPLRERLKDRGVSQQELAKRLGITAHAVSRKMNNKSMWCQDEIYAMSELLGIVPEQLKRYFFTPKVQKCEQ